MKASHLLLPLLLLLASCGGDYPESEEEGVPFGSDKVRAISGTLDISAGAIQGSGSALFNSRYETFQSGGSYALDFTLADGGSLTLVSHANSSLSGGFELLFRRDGAALKVSLHAQGSSWEATTQFNAIDASGALRLQVDVHNDESPAHIVVWDRATAPDFEDHSATLNSADEIDGSPGIGSGIRWGLVLGQATVTSAERSAPKLEGH